MSNHNVIREFNTPNYVVRVLAEEEFDSDLSWDDTGRVRKQLEAGDLIEFCAHVEVIHRPTGAVLGEDFLGNCIYKSLGAFADHRACGRQNRRWAKQGKTGQCGSYFADMISEAITEARKNYPKTALGQLRKV